MAFVHFKSSQCEVSLDLPVCYFVHLNLQCNFSATRHSPKFVVFILLNERFSGSLKVSRA